MAAKPSATVVTGHAEGLQLPAHDRQIHLDVVYDQNLQRLEMRRSVSRSAIWAVDSRTESRTEGRADADRLSAPISPCMSSTSCLQMARPSPVPPKRRVIELSAG